MNRVLVLPVSGGAFPHQLALLEELLSVTPDPHQVVLGTSGGNVCANLLLAANYNLRRFDKIIDKLDGNIFAKEWSELNVLPTSVWAYLKGSAYQQVDPVPLFESIFKCKNMQAFELWTTTYNRSAQKVQLWCNKGSSSLNFDSFDPLENRCLPPRLLDGNVTMMAKVAMASASIPLMVEGIMIDTSNVQVLGSQSYVHESSYDLHQDGGVAASSPLSVLRDPLIATYNSLHIDYISSYDIESLPPTKPALTMIDKSLQTLKSLLQSLNYSDRRVAIDLIKTTGKSTHEEGIADAEVLAKLQTIRATHKRSLLELYPESSTEIDIINIKIEQIRSIIKTSRHKYRYRLWLSSH